MADLKIGGLLLENYIRPLSPIPTRDLTKKIVGDTENLLTILSLDKVDGPFTEVDKIEGPFQESLGPKGIILYYYIVNGIRMSLGDYNAYVEKKGTSRNWYMVNGIRMSEAEYEQYKAKKNKE